MEHQRQQHGHVDEYGNPVGTRAGHGQMAQGGMGTHGTAGGMGMGMGTHGTTGASAGAGQGGQFQPMREEHKTGGVLQRSGSSSSSSSEDDGMGGRRKKGIKEKIKEKLPGGNKDNQQQQHTMGGTGAATYGQQGHSTGMTGTTGAHGTTTDTGEKKGLMDKIKVKLPGGNKDNQQQQHTMGGTGAATYGQQGHGTGMTGTTGAHGTTTDTGEKKGLMGKIKEKLPGQH